GQPLAATGAGGGELGGGADEGLVAARHLPAAGGPAGQEAGVPGGGPPAAADRLHRAEHRPALRGAGGGLLSAGGQGPAEGAAPSTPATVGLSGHGHGTGRLTQDSYFRGSKLGPQILYLRLRASVLYSSESDSPKNLSISTMAP